MPRNRKSKNNKGLNKQILAHKTGDLAVLEVGENHGRLAETKKTLGDFFLFTKRGSVLGGCSR